METKLEELTTDQIVKTHMVAVPANKDAAIEKIETALKNKHRGHFDQADKGVEEYFAARISDNYPQIDRETIRDLQHEVAIGTYREKYIVPVFAKAILGKDTAWRERVHAADGSSYKSIILEANMPEIPNSARLEAKAALAYVFQVFSDALREETLGDVLLAGLGDSISPQAAEIEILWKPKLKDLRVVPDTDPVMLLYFHHNYYLVHQWDSAHEEPLPPDFINTFLRQQRNDTIEDWEWMH